MKRNNIYYLLEYLSPTLVLSFFLFHNIRLVLLGIVFSIYLININYIENFISSIKSNILIKKSSKEFNQNEKVIESDTLNLKSTKKDSKLTLVEEIEEYGFIPSIDNSEDTNVA
ncbi:hypothetical protein [Prochlorococcus marinus]|uniref:hypothetical protein n=1 Tax=Prochlorococcus marinus TaxID=1219 RepID=UPI0022B341FF|nr:hypothetical protein [Prochlorococcus marinus]